MILRTSLLLTLTASILMTLPTGSLQANGLSSTVEVPRPVVLRTPCDLTLLVNDSYPAFVYGKQDAVSLALALDQMRYMIDNPPVIIEREDRSFWADVKRVGIAALGGVVVGFILAK